VVKLVVLTLALGLGEAYLMQLSRTGDEPELIFQLREFVARAGAAIAMAFDDDVSRDSVMIRGKQMQLIVSVECTALFAKALFCAAALSYPAKWRYRLAGCVIGLIGVALLNILRVAGLVLISNGSPSLFEFAHTVLMQWFLISCVAPLWLLWAVWATKRSQAASA
jgi:exosortase/archaeosortase family protein